MSFDRPSFRDCHRAARRVEAAPLGRAALRAVRPSGVSGVFRARAPLTLILFAAGLEDRVVWQGCDGFALLEPPIARPEAWRPRPGLGAAALRWLDRYWSTVVFAVPGLTALAVAVSLLPFGSLHAIALLITVAAMAYTVTVLSIMFVWQLFFGRDEEPSARAAGTVAADHWNMPLLHQENEQRLGELFDQIERRLHHLVAEKVRQDAADHGGQVGRVRLTTRLICLRTGVTTDKARAYLSSTRSVITREYSVLFFDARPEDLERRPAKPPAFFRFYLAAVVIVVFALAYLVMVVERGSCTETNCAAGATTYGRALAWIGYRLLWQQAPGVDPVSDFAIALGLLLSLPVPMVALVAVVAFRAQYRADQTERNIQRDREKRMGNTRVLIVTVADVERDAVLDAIEGHTRKVVDPTYDGPVPVFAMGTINDAELYVVQAGTQGTSGPAGALTVTADAIRHLAPHYALIVGICYGLRPDRQRLGDILVSEKIKDLDHAKLVELDGRIEERLRGETVVPSPLLLNSVRAAQRSWLRRNDTAVHVGLMLAWNKLLNAEPVVNGLVAKHPDAIGGDMEGAGFQAAARVAGVESMLIKSVCDWGADKTDDAQPMAARNAAAFVLHLACSGVLSHTPADRRGY
ncbi:5'-methylthioadenosine/S-adenosylhomocysteine nucleosidase family protein [Nocardia araoensis]|uniref:5'-methylthioadenosine/S-adenosylhomocysteine nucleosidase family protein n=1 Tax=Nocardia araoensis TaxID=228600 RepID=UPI0002DE9B36|nr:hypothetical protein [Nocardia araoensis]